MYVVLGSFSQCLFFCVSSQLMKALNLEGITIFSAQFVPWPLASAGRKRRATEYV
jgi:hypothetical protein